MARRVVDPIHPVNPDYSLCARRRHWFQALPGDRGTEWRDLAHPSGGATLSYAPLARTDRPGGWLHAPTSGSGIACTTTVDGGSGSGMTVAFWAKADDTTDGYHCVWRAPGWGNPAFYRFFGVWGFYNDAMPLVGSTVVTPGVWVRWLLSVSGNGGSGGTIAVYRDGQFVASESLGSLVFTNFGSSTLTLGGDAFGQYFAGSLDDFDVYPWALSDGMARADYRQSALGYPRGLRRPSSRPSILLAGSTPAPSAIVQRRTFGPRVGSRGLA